MPVFSQPIGFRNRELGLWLAPCNACSRWVRESMHARRYRCRPSGRMPAADGAGPRGAPRCVCLGMFNECICTLTLALRCVESEQIRRLNPPYCTIVNHLALLDLKTPEGHYSFICRRGVRGGMMAAEQPESLGCTERQI